MVNNLSEKCELTCTVAGRLWVGTVEYILNPTRAAGLAPRRTIHHSIAASIDLLDSALSREVTRFNDNVAFEIIVRRAL